MELNSGRMIGVRLAVTRWHGEVCVQARASRLSYNDIVKRLAATEDTHPTFISKKVVPLPCNDAACQPSLHRALQPLTPAALTIASLCLLNVYI